MTGIGTKIHGLAAHCFRRTLIRASLSNTILRPQALSASVEVNYNWNSMPLNLQTRQFSSGNNQKHRKLQVDMNMAEDSKQKMLGMAEKGDFVSIVQHVATKYQPLVNRLQGLTTEESFDPDTTARIEQEAMALLVQHRATDAALILLDNLQEMTSASDIVQPMRQTLSFAIGILNFQRDFDRIPIVYNFAKAFHLPTESMNASYLKALVMKSDFKVAARVWRNLCAKKHPRGQHAYQEALNIFNTLGDAKEIHSLLDDIDIHGIKLREIDFQRAMEGLASSFETEEDASDYADLILELYEKMQNFENITPTMPKLIGSVMEACNYLGDCDRAFEVHEMFISLPEASRNPKQSAAIYRALVDTLIGLERVEYILPRIQQSFVSKRKDEATIMAEKLILYLAKSELDTELMDTLRRLPTITMKFRNDGDAMTVLHKVVRTRALNEVELWTFLSSNLSLLNLNSPFWWWKCLNLAENAKKWRLMQLMLETQRQVTVKQWKTMASNCGRRIQLDDIDGHAFVVFSAEKIPVKNQILMGYLVTAYTQTQQHLKAIETFRELNKMTTEPKISKTPYVSAQKSLLALGYDAEAKQIETILAFLNKVVES